MPSPRLLAGRMPDETRELMYTIAGLPPATLARLREDLRTWAKGGATEVLEIRVAAVFGCDRIDIERVNLAFTTVTGVVP